jgi:hypothetical protein
MSSTKTYYLKLRLCGTLLLAGVLSASLLTSPVQANQGKVRFKAAVLDTALNNLQGFYRLPNNVAYLEIVKRDNGLIAKQQWDGKEYLLLKKSALEFVSRDEEYKGEFLKDESGKIVALKILNRLVLKKVDYNPGKVAVVPYDKLMALQGTYQFKKDPKLFLEIAVTGNAIVLKELWSGKTIRFSPLSEADFYNKELKYPIQFIKDANKITRLICFQSDEWNKLP